MDISDILSGLIDTNPSPVVICDLDYRVIYMNKTAVKDYAKYGGADLVGKLITPFCGEEAMSKVNMVIEWFKESKDNNRVFGFHTDEKNTDVYLVAIRDKKGRLAAFTSIHECRTPETGESYKMD